MNKKGIIHLMAVSDSPGWVMKLGLSSFYNQLSDKIGSYSFRGFSDYARSLQQTGANIARRKKTERVMAVNGSEWQRMTVNTAKRAKFAIAFEAETVTYEAEAVAYEPETITYEVEAVAFEWKAIAFRWKAVTYEREAIAFK